MKLRNWRCWFGWHPKQAYGFMPTVYRGEIVLVCICDKCGKQFMQVCD